MKRQRLFLVACGLTLLGWLGYALLGSWLAEQLVSRFGASLTAAFQHKFSNPAVFVHHRLREALWLWTLALGWVAAHQALREWLRRRTRGAARRWVFHAAAGFICLNFWVGAAGNTLVFWAALGAGAGVQNQTQFHIKRILLAEDPAPVRVALLGSSQTRTQIEERRLNELLGGRAWSFELHYPGSHAFDIWLVGERLRRADPPWVVCYLNESHFHQGSHSEAASCFLGVTEVPDLIRLRALDHVPGPAVAAGLFGGVLPVFRDRQVFAQRFLGATVANLKQAEYDAGLQPDLEERAAAMAPQFKVDAGSDFQKRAFAAFVARCQADGRRVILLRGGFNPLLERRISPAVRGDLDRFLEELQARHPVVTVIPAADLPAQAPADYEDLNHCNPDMQRRFTEALAVILRRLAEAEGEAP